MTKNPVQKTKKCFKIHLGLSEKTTNSSLHYRSNGFFVSNALH